MFAVTVLNILTSCGIQIFLPFTARTYDSRTDAACFPHACSSSLLRETPAFTNTCRPHWTSRPRTRPNCACWQWLGLAAGCMLSEAAERSGFHSTSCLPSLQWKSPVMWRMGLSPNTTRNASGNVAGSGRDSLRPHGTARIASGGI